jgi:tRNA dimethylallyltransferase
MKNSVLLQEKTKALFIITGPTGVGKTDVALDLASRLPIEIINADSGQFYKPLTIGTAKPAWHLSPIPHHGFDILTEPILYTVVEYRAYVEQLCNEIWGRGKIPLLVGGSLFYIQSLFFPPRARQISTQCPEVDPSWDALYAIDPLRAQAIHPHDTYRIARALTLWQTTACKPSSLSLVYEPWCYANLIFLTRQKELLYQRINERVIQMFEQGFVNEVLPLQDTAWEPFLQQKKFIGYDDILAYLRNGSHDIQQQQELITRIQKKTRHYAKRQHTFWRGLCQRIAQADGSTQKVTATTIDLTTYDYDLYINDLLPLLQRGL